jgi:agmatinase
MTQPTGVTPPHYGSWSNLATQDSDAQIGLLGVPFDNATSFRKGSAMAPATIRQITPYIATFTEAGHSLADLRVRDYGDVHLDLNWERYFATVETLAANALSHSFTLFIGGDHSVTIPLVAAFGEAVSGRLGYIQFDSHPDLMDEYNGHKWSHACTARRALEKPGIEPRHMAFVGIRSWLGKEVDFVASHPEIAVHSAVDVHERGIEAMAEDVVSQLEGLDAIYFSLDIDGLDPAYAPGTGTPEAGGLSTRQLLSFLRIIFARLPVRALDLVEVAPPLDHADITSVAAIKIIYEVFGWVHAKDKER